MEPKPSPHPHPAPSTLYRWSGPIGAALLLAITALWLSTRGLIDDSPSATGIAAAAWMIIVSGGLAAAYLAGAIGLGRLAAWALLGPSPSRTPSRTWLQAPLGLGLMLFLSHLLGVLGLLGGPLGLYISWGVVAAGVLLLTDQVVRAELRPENWPILPPWGILAAPPIALMLIAAASPPGALWASEHGAYDSLSYHLQLPKEWLDAGRLWPLEHNVYSFLPSYMEAAFMHLGAMAQPFGAGPGITTPGAAYLNGEAVGLVAAHYLHALIGLLAAALTGRLVWTFLTTRAVGDRTATFAGVLAAAVLLSTPWVVVVGTLAYNELAVLALGAGAMLAAADRHLRPVRRATLAGLLVGLACGAKPTAAFTVGPAAGLLLLGLTTRAECVKGITGRPQTWAAMAAAGSAAALLAMLPWLARNFLASGNPVFPFATRLFGSAHWSAEQVERYALAHHFEGTWPDRLDLLLSADRGIAHPQWFILFPAGIAGLLVAMAWRRSRWPAVLLSLGLAALIAAWLTLTHLQSRFLLPAAPILAAGVGLGAAALLAAVAQGITPGVPQRRWLPLAAAVITAGLPVALAFRSVNIFLSQLDGYPNAVMQTGVPRITYLPFLAEFQALPEWDQTQIVKNVPRPEAFTNLVLDPGATIYLLGDATPLYYAGRTLYHTTWDASPLARLVLEHPGRADGPMGALWAQRLHDRGVRFILVSEAELRRLVDKDRWYDPVITVPLVELWVSTFCDLVHAWPDRRQFLFALNPPPPQSPPQPPPPEPAPAESADGPQP